MCRVLGCSPWHESSKSCEFRPYHFAAPFLNPLQRNYRNNVSDCSKFSWHVSLRSAATFSLKWRIICWPLQESTSAPWPRKAALAPGIFQIHENSRRIIFARAHKKPKRILIMQAFEAKRKQRKHRTGNANPFLYVAWVKMAMGGRGTPMQWDMWDYLAQHASQHQQKHHNIMEDRILAA